MKTVVGLFLCGVVAGGLGCAPATETGSPLVTWEELPPLPDKEGFAGMFAGVSNGALIAAGGANFPVKPPWEGGEKVWYDAIHVLEKPDGKWRAAAQKLPRPLAYGVCVTHSGMVVCIGGGDAAKHYADAYALKRAGGRIETVPLPPLPRPCAQTCGALLGSVVYVAGGIDSPGATKALHTFWALDLSKPRAERRWVQLEPWPGPERFQSVPAVLDGAFYLLGGIRLEKGPDGKPKRIAPYLTDAYRYTPGKGGAKGRWERIANLPRGVAAAPCPALALPPCHILVFGGVDGSLLGVDLPRHPGFSREILIYDATTNTWAKGGLLPDGSSRVTAPTVSWRGGCAVVSGERAPGRRSPKVYWARPR